MESPGRPLKFRKDSYLHGAALGAGFAGGVLVTLGTIALGVCWTLGLLEATAGGAIFGLFATVSYWVAYGWLWKEYA